MWIIRQLLGGNRIVDNILIGSLKKFQRLFSWETKKGNNKTGLFFFMRLINKLHSYFLNFHNHLIMFFVLLTVV